MIISVLLLVLIIPNTVCFASGRLCISELGIQSGENAAEALEAEGFTVIYQNLNPSGERIYLGYKLGEKPVTGLTVSSEYKTSLSVDGIAYSPVSALNLNEGTDGSPVYLYVTREVKAGSGIAALNFVKDNKDPGANLLENFGDGSVPVMTADGRLADFDEGIEERSLYLLAVRDNSCLPYISEIKTVNVGKSDNAFKAIAESGFVYFNPEPVSQADSADTYLCFNRTADAGNAVRFAALSDTPEIDGIQYTSAGEFDLNGKTCGLYYTKSKDVGSPVVQITPDSLFEGTVTFGDWAAMYFGRASFASSCIYEEEAYAALLQSTEEYMQLGIKNKNSSDDAESSGLYMILASQGPVSEAAPDTVTVPQAQNESVELQRDTEVTGIEKETSPDITAADKTVDAYGSAIGGGSLIAIAVFAIISVIAAFVFVTVGGRKKESDI